MRAPTSPDHVSRLIERLRAAADGNIAAADAHEHGGLGLCLGAALANDAADALQALLADASSAERPAEDTGRETDAAKDKRR